MLPEGFQWISHFDGHALALDGRVVAKYAVTPGAPYVLAYFHCGSIRMGGRIYPGEVYARAYIEGWARRWRTELRQEYGRYLHSKAVGNRITSTPS